ncbi:MAG TPA: hypothetical protein PKE00_08520, partial [Planctomycetota bacterium]|nr:hypothetical protein [Planctomycetota bacterium]
MTHKNVSWLARSRRSLLLSGCFALLATTAAVAQSTQPLELEIDHNGTGWSDEQTLPTADWEEPIKFRIKGNYAEWVRLVVDAWAQDEELIGEFPEMGIDYYEVANNPIFPWQADPNSPKVGVLPARMVFAVDIGLRNLNTFAPDGQALRDWYVPLRQTGMWREWKYDSELWVNNPQHGTGFGAMNRTWWEANSKAATGVGATSSEFSAEALFRWAVLLRMAATYES